jgi:WD40 repeat protein
MDSNICIWEPTGISCKYLTDNTGSISKLITNDTEKILISGSYDSSVRLFDLNSLQCISTLSGVHKNAVTEIEAKNSLCISGSKDGSLAIWDLNKEKCIKQAKIHGGLIKNIKFLFEGNVSNNNDNDIYNNNDIDNENENILGDNKNENKNFDMNYILTAGVNDGILNVIDMRSNNPIFSKQVYI